jgi:branched-subunit amino acid ABC-type transport system permease component
LESIRLSNLSWDSSSSSIFASAILGGIGSATTAVGGAFFVGLAEEVSLIWLGDL